MVTCQVIFVIFAVYWFTEAESLLIKPWKKCIPTTTVQGICHTCACAVDGVSYCQPEYCRDDDIGTARSNSKECEPYLMYRDGNIFCQCDATGYWRSMNCKDRYDRIHPKTTLIRQMFRTNIACTPNASYLIDCNICHCDSSGFIEPVSCTNRLCAEGHKADTCKAGDVLRVENEFCVCSDINYYVDRLCLKLTNDVIQKLDIVKLSKIFNIGQDNYDVPNNGCVANETYTVDCNTCFCTPKGYLGCTHKYCTRDRNDKENLRVKHKNPVLAFNSLPELKSEDERCKPGKSYRFKCNTCVCAVDGHPTCSTMLCLEDFTWSLNAFRALRHVSQGNR